MRLRTFESFWLLKNGLLNSYPSLRNNEKSSIVVVGGGITGALVSHALVENGYEVLLIDKRDIAWGSTSATTSMIQYELDVPLYQLIDTIGEDAAAKCYNAGVDAIQKLDKLVNENNIECGFEKKQSLYFAHNNKAKKNLLKEFELRKKHGLEVQWLNAEDIMAKYGLITYGGILSAIGASADVYQLAHKLIKFNSQRGMKVFDQTPIEKFELNTDNPFIVTSNGYTIKCDKVIFCTGFESTEMLKEKVADLFYTYASVSEKNVELSQEWNNTLVWDTDSPYTYMRTTDDGRLLIGGEDSSNNFGFFQQKKKELKARKLFEKLKKIMPGFQFVDDFNWGGTFGSTKDGLPYIGASPEFENALFVLGFGGNGITFSLQAMDIIPDLLKGKPNELSYYYRFGR